MSAWSSYCLRAGACSLAAIGLVAALVLSVPAASASPRKKPTDDKASSAVAPKFAVHPNDITLAVAQTQSFGVTGTDGKPVSVRWKISGVGCSNATCGTIDSNGNYQAPQTVSQPLVVMLEGIPLSDSEFPAFARIQLAPGMAPPAPAVVRAESRVTPQVSGAHAYDAQASDAQAWDAQGSEPQASESTPEVSAPDAGAAVATVVSADVSVPRGPAVTYQNGLLAIDATNATLADVLRLVAQKTGAIIDIPPGTGLEPIVVEHAGPAPAGDVLARLLKGSHFNFVVIGSPQRPNELGQVLLSPRTDIATPEVAAAPTPVAPAPVEEPAVATATPPDPARPHPGPLTRDELREILKERAREIREHPPQTAPPAQ